MGLWRSKITVERHGQADKAVIPLAGNIHTGWLSHCFVESFIVSRLQPLPQHTPHGTLTSLRSCLLLQAYVISTLPGWRQQQHLSSHHFTQTLKSWHLLGWETRGCPWETVSLTTYCLLVAAGGQPGSRRQELTEKNKTLSFKSRILWDRILVTRHSGFRERKN